MPLIVIYMPRFICVLSICLRTIRKILVLLHSIICFSRPCRQIGHHYFFFIVKRFLYDLKFISVRQDLVRLLHLIRPVSMPGHLLRDARQILYRRVSLFSPAPYGRHDHGRRHYHQRCDQHSRPSFQISFHFIDLFFQTTGTVLLSHPT